MARAMRVAVLAGDGIGAEVTREALKALDAVGARSSLRFDYVERLVGGAAVDESGDPLPASTLEVCRDSDAILLGAVGGPIWDHLPLDRRPESALLRLRSALNCYANLRPIRLDPSLADRAPIKTQLIERGVDIMIVRELAHGLYYGHRGRRRTPDGDVEAFDTAVYSTADVEQVARLAFSLACARRRQVCSLDKSNILETSRLWREVITQVARDYPEVVLRHQLIDSGAMLLLLQPGDFDVVVTNNEFGDIISDEASVLAGSLGMIPSASIGPDPPFLYEPIHGSAPDIAGKGVANPIGAILTVAMMLRHSFSLEAEAQAIELAVARTLAAGHRTADLARPGESSVSTAQMGDLIVAALCRQ